MKHRDGFVSNSSSSSFIVYRKGDTRDTREIPNECITERSRPFEQSVYKVLCLPSKEYGDTAFGWDNKRYHGLMSRLNWCAIQMMYTKNTDAGFVLDNGEKVYTWRLKENFRNVVEECFGVAVEYNYNSIEYDGFEGGFAYIDHQSSICEDRSIPEFFADPEAIEAFLTGEHSYIQGGNDNDRMDGEWLESLKLMRPKAYELFYGDENESED